MLSVPEMLQIETDVVVVGSGSAGGMAALSARRAGAEVALVDKGGIYRSGCGAAGEDHFIAVLELGEDWDTPEAFLKWYNGLSQGLCNPRVVENGFLRNIKGLVRYLEELGVTMRLDRERDDYIRTGSYSSPGRYWINFDGRDLPPKVASEAKKAGVDFYPRTAVTDLLVKDGQLVGVVALEYRSGRLYLFRAKAAVLCTGNVGRLYDNPSGEPFNLWNSPFNTGLAQKVAFEAGAKLANMEFIGFNLTPKNFGSPGLAGLTGMGAHVVNAAGERIVFKYHPLGEQGPRWALCQAVYWETKEGRGPCYIDARHLTERDMKHLLTHLLPVDKKSFGDYLQQKGIDLRKDLLEVEVSGGEIPAMSGHASGILVDEDYSTTVPGIYAAGASALSFVCLSGGMCSGIAAGQSAAGYAARTKGLPSPDGERLREIQARVYAPLEKRRDGITHRRFEDKLRQIMSRYVRIGRTEKGLKTALSELQWLRGRVPSLAAADGHELMRCLEAQELLAVAETIARGALVREESRFGLSHYRGDFPEPRPEWHRSVLQAKVGDGVEISFQPPCQL
ncbi:MAG: FAD-dependent oxidoreductase [Chloroflexota bacterium]